MIMKKKIKTTISIFLILAILLTGAYLGLQNIREKNRRERSVVPVMQAEGYLKSEGAAIELYSCELTIEEDLLGRISSRKAVFTPAANVVRGTAAILMDQPELDDDGNIIYERYTVDGKEYFAKPGHFTEDINEVISEKTRFARTPVTIYKSPDDCRIAGFAPKGSELEIKGCDYLREDGSVNMYNVSYDGTEGYVFSKYLTETKDEALTLYNEHGEADFHKNAVASYETYGGDPLLLDYYPYEKLDCSGLCRLCYKRIGKEVSSVAHYIFDHGKKVNSKAELKPGDIVGFNNHDGKPQPGHVGIYIGGDRYIHSPGRGKKITYGYLSSNKNYYGARNYID